MRFHILAETAPNSDTFVPTGEVLDLSADEAAVRALAIAAERGVRTGLHVYEPLRAAAPEPPPPAAETLPPEPPAS